MNTSSVKYWLMLICLLGAVYASFVVWRHSTGQVQAGSGGARPIARSALSASEPQPLPSGPLADFVLVDQDGRDFDSQSLRGKVWVASFFFANCPAVCWRMNQTLSAWQQTHPGSEARFISITCDPANDTPPALARYAEHFKADPKRWTFLTGDMKKIQSIGQDSFKISVVEKDHSDRAVVVDRKGQVRGRFRLTEPDQVEMLDRLLAVVEAEPPDVSESPRDSAADALEQAPGGDIEARVPSSS